MDFPTDMKTLVAIYRDILDEMRDPVYLCDGEARILFMNKAAEKVDGIHRDAVYGRPFDEVYTVDKSVSPFMQALKSGKEVRLPRYSYWIRGREVVQSCVAKPVLANGAVIGAFSVQHDLTEMREIVEENISLQKEMTRHRRGSAGVYSLRSLVGESPAFSACRRMALQAADTDSSVMLVGATGSGKEVFARAIHENSPRRNGPFLALNCAAIPEDLLEGILFGTAKGVYTGAVEREGLLLQAEGGTVFLDEMNSMPPASQAKLLRVLEERTVYKLGEAKGRPIDVRLISSCNELPQNAIDRGALREDLFYRLSVVYIRIPSLSERREDIPLLVNYFIAEYNRRFGKNVLGVADDVMSFFVGYPWTGNVRQLRHSIESAMNFTEDGQWISFSALPPYLFDAMLGDPEPADLPPAAPEPKPVPEPMKKETEKPQPSVSESEKAPPTTVLAEIRAAEREEMIAALREARGNMAKAARAMGMNRQAFVYRAKKYHLK